MPCLLGFSPTRFSGGCWVPAGKAAIALAGRVCRMHTVCKVVQDAEARGEQNAPPRVLGAKFPPHREKAAWPTCAMPSPVVSHPQLVVGMGNRDTTVDLP